MKVILKNTSNKSPKLLGKLTEPAKFRGKFGLKRGAFVSFTETDEGILVTPQSVLATQLMDEIGEILRKSDATLDGLRKSGQKTRAALIKERYHLDTEK